MDSTLSPRLAHLMIKEDSRGRLVLPGSPSTMSPPISPLSSTFTPSPSQGPSSLPTLPGAHNLLPPPAAFNAKRRPSASIFSLLNDLHVVTPPSSASSAMSLQAQQSALRTPQMHPVSPRLRTSHGVPPHPTHPYLVDQHRRSVSSISQRPDIRRHSSQPYQPAKQAVTFPHEADFGVWTGSRAPISRTTKACNACRSRKVRCDAGGLTSGETTTCSRCREAGVACVYTGVQKKRGPCPGTLRPPTATRPPTASQPRPSSQHSRSSNSSEQQLVTPPDISHDDWPPATSRSSYGFPPPSPSKASSGWTSVQPRPLDPNATVKPRPVSGWRQQPAVLSWPQMEPATEMGQRRMFSDEYTIRAKPQPLIASEREDRTSYFGSNGISLPPLRIAIGRRDSYFEP